ncbi:phenylalanine--tRNA ligase, alpha subunit [Opisthorchis viverrini]|uniref:phenylalanine--tRNA ligase n=1 Tax=Opisthorchis viverrini TaxID=6198 RepID=A0A1S8WQD3_OPIVI|nr:phenylalanine--tRNA ligase, alpha subunit [Opisthorchis viverrini]
MAMEIVRLILSELESHDELRSTALAEQLRLDHQTVVGGIKSLQSLGDIDDAVEDVVQQMLSKFLLDSNCLSDAQKTDFRKRKLITEVGSWKTTRFKAYNFNALGATLPSGHLHPLLRVREEFSKILSDMGFTEMPTNNYVECSFWNFDSLFQPQQHPARDAHDTFFISDPAITELSRVAPADYVDRVSKVHSQGSFGSRGYQSEWLVSEAEKNLLRTHTTAVSARMLYALAKQTPVVPVRYFSIDRVFRNETLDATHLAEFHQVEGLVADFGLGLGHLKAVIRAFFNKLGLAKLRFKPAYNPYTEPSMEIFSYHPGLQKWVEIGNSGIFRPEMLRPMGLPEGLTVIAWGLSLERPTMIRYGYKNIRDLIGPKIDLNMVYTAPLCRLDKF